ELVAAHDLGADRGAPGGGDGLIGAEHPLGLHAAPDAQLAEPVEELPLSVAEGGFSGLAFARGIPIERDDEVVDAQFGHGSPPRSCAELSSIESAIKSAIEAVPNHYWNAAGMTECACMHRRRRTDRTWALIEPILPLGDHRLQPSPPNAPRAGRSGT